MRIEIDYMPLVPVFLNQKGPYTFAVDTGYHGPNVSPKVADELGLKKNEDECVVLETFAVGELLFQDFEIYVSDRPKLWNLLREEIAGVIGMGFLKYFEVTIDYRESTMSLLPMMDLVGKPPNVQPDFSYVRIKYPNRYIAVPVHINETGPYDFVLDTGAKTTVVSEEIAGKLNLTRGDRKIAYGAVDDKSCRDSVVENLRIGKRGVDDLRVIIMDTHYLSKYADCKIEGNIGYNFLRRFSLTMNVLDLYVGLSG
jgi:predicted aspartyl protease